MWGCSACFVAALGGAVVAFFGFGVMIHGWPDSTIAAAWVQAIGSIGAILAAFFIAQDQHRKDLARQAQQRQDEAEASAEAERLEVARLLQALRDEIEVRRLQFHLIIGQHVERCEQDQWPFFDSYNLMSEDPFPVYRSLLPRLTLIQDKALRQRIVRCYAVMESLVLTIATNSEFAKEYQEAVFLAKTTSGLSDTPAVIQKRAQLLHYFPMIISMRDAAQQEVEELLRLIPEDAVGDSMSPCFSAPPT